MLGTSDVIAFVAATDLDRARAFYAGTVAHSVRLIALPKTTSVRKVEMLRELSLVSTSSRSTSCWSWSRASTVARYPDPSTTSQNLAGLVRSCRAGTASTSASGTPARA